jgi:vacuolar protein sorting-associated protein 33A
VDDAIHTTAEPFETNLKTVVYFVRPRIDIMKDISKQILSFTEKKRIFVYFVPRRNLISEITLQKTGVYDLIEQPIGEYTLDLIPYDNDLLSMEIPHGYSEIHMVLLFF